MNRRRFLAFVGGMMSSLPVSRGKLARKTATPPPTPPGSDGQETTLIDAETATERRTADYFVDVTGHDTDDGSRAAPLNTVQEAFDRAQAGNIIHVNPGLYFVREDGIRTKRSGEAGKPITLTGPPEAVLTVADGVTNRLPILLVRHSHIRVSGMTFDGLGDRDPIGPPAFAHSLINCLPLPSTDAYLKGLTISPDAIGNALGAGISLTRVKHSKVGGFELIGPIGVEYLQFERTEPIGEVVYVGTALETLNSDWYPGENPDLTSNIQIEHIDNSAGYSHSELVDTKLGTHDVTIEYCSDIGGAQAGDAGWIMGAVNISGRSTVVRGCELSNHDIHGVKIGASAARKGTNPHPIVSDAGTNNSVYGNRLMNNSGKAVKFLFGNQNSDDQTVLCRNKYNGRTDGNPGKKCPENNCGGQTGSEGF